MSNVAVRIMCPNLRCRAVLAVPAEARGRLVRCRNCGMNIKIPHKQDAAAGAPPKPADGTGAEGGDVEKKKAG